MIEFVHWREDVAGRIWILLDVPTHPDSPLCIEARPWNEVAKEAQQHVDDLRWIEHTNY